MTEPLRLRLYSSPLGLYLTAAGRLDADTAACLAQAIGLVLRRLPGRPITVDLSGLDTINAAGIGVLLLYRAAAARHGVRLRVADPPPHIRAAIDAHGSDLLDSTRPSSSCRVLPTPSWRRCHRPSLRTCRPPAASTAHHEPTPRSPAMTCTPTHPRPSARRRRP